jgi:hypothetical protein
MTTEFGRVPDGTGLSQAEPCGLVPSGFDPSRIGSGEHAALKRALLSSVKRRPIARRQK